MQTHDKATTDNAHSSQEAPAQQKQGSLAGIKDKMGYGFTTVPTFISLTAPHPAV
jgi:hypothetical protein